MAGKEGCDYPNQSLAMTLGSNPDSWKVPWEAWWPQLIKGLDFISRLRNATFSNSFLEYHAEAFFLSESERKVHPSTAARCPWGYLLCFSVSLYNLRAQGTYIPFAALVYKENRTLLVLDAFTRNSEHNPTIFKTVILRPLPSCDFCCLKCESPWIFDLWIATNQPNNLPLWY